MSMTPQYYYFLVVSRAYCLLPTLVFAGNRSPYESFFVADPSPQLQQLQRHKTSILLGGSTSLLPSFASIHPLPTMEITLRERFSAIGHRTFVFHGPCAPATFENLVAACAPHLRAFGASHAHAPAQAQAHAHTHAEVEVCTERHYTGPILLDAGCGRAELTLRLLEIEPNMSAVGVDSSQHATQTAILQGMGRVAPGRLRVMCEGFNADKHRCKTGYEGFVCVGSEHVCGGWEKTIATARDLLGTRGLCVLGMLCWERTPPEDVEGMMGDAGSIPMHGELVIEFEREFEKFFSHTVADEEWATYQDGYIANFDDYLRANPCDPDLGWIAERRSQLEQMHTATKGWLGFVLLAGTRRQ